MKKIILLVALIAIYADIYSQADPQIVKYRSEPLGNRQFRKEGIMDGNLVRTLFYNNGEVGQWPFSPSLEWPKGSGHAYCDGVCALIEAEVKAPGNQQVIHLLETSYREEMDKDPVTGEIWGLEPVPGYVRAGSEKPAINTDKTTWPEVWPKTLPNLDDTWDGYWFGYFGRGVQNADFETFFVMDDSKDGEFSRAPYNYFPIESDHSRKGLGLRVEVRGFQWSHVLAEDIIFWHYDIVNLSDNDYVKTVFGFYTDTGVGGPNDNGDDCAFYDKKLDLTYGYDFDGLGSPNSFKTGYYGYAYLESPGNSSNGIDDDEDGLVDEKRDDLIDNDGDWMPYSDFNHNGKWDANENEPLNSDLGKDGVGPFDPQYNGPDLGEGDGKPTPGEPNFDATDKDESDQIGLTSLSIYRLGSYGTGGGWPKDDESMWLKMNYNSFDTTLQKANISMTFGSGPFPLQKYKRERFSMALLFGNDLEDLIFNKVTVQQIYNANYNFSKPPLKPSLKAVAGDKQVHLYWNSIAEESRDPFLGYENNDATQGFKKDFEGYLVYRSTEPEFNDIKVVTDMNGEPKYWKPIARFDKIDGIKGADPVGINGAHFNRGTDNGLAHSYVDTDVLNGQKYYYAVVSYDMGDPKFGTAGLVPSECTKIISEDLSNNLKFVDINCAVVTPNAPAAGYVPPQITGDISRVKEGIGTGQIKVNLLNSGEIQSNAVYQVKFRADGNPGKYRTSSLFITRTQNGVVDTVIRSMSSAEFGFDKSSDPFDGLAVSVFNDTTIAVVDSSSGWQIGESNLEMSVRPDSTLGKSQTWPADYEIHFYDQRKAITPFQKISVNFLVINTTSGDTVAAEIFDRDKNKLLSIGDEIVILEPVGKDYKYTWKINYHNPTRPNAMPIHPKAGDVFVIKTKKQFYNSDYFTFSTKSEFVDVQKAQSDLDKISVVPNPYISAAKWERRNLNQTGRGERRIDFINLPAQCTIRIYEVSGALVKTLDKNSGSENGSLSWNLVSEDGMNIAYGIYIYHVDAPGIGTKIGKFAIIK